MHDIFKTLRTNECLLSSNGKFRGGLRTKGISNINSSCKPSFSVITVVLNGERCLEQTIQSVISQTYDNFEYLVVDGGSKDKTLEIIKKYDNEIDYWVSESDHGIYNAMNKGISLAQGDWLIFINSDDLFWKSDVLEQLFKQLAELPESIRVAYGQIMFLDSNGKSLFLIGKPWNKVKNHFSQAMSIPHPGVFHHRNLFKTHGLFDDSYQCAGDYELLLRELLTADAHFIKDIVITGMRNGGISNRPEETLNNLKEVRKAQIKHGLLIPKSIWLFSLIKVYIRILLWHILGEKLTRKLLDWGRRLMGLKAVWVLEKRR